MLVFASCERCVAIVARVHEWLIYSLPPLCYGHSKRAMRFGIYLSSDTPESRAHASRSLRCALSSFAAGFGARSFL